MSLAVVRAIRERNPRARITLTTEFHEFLTGHPLLDRVFSPDEARAGELRQVISLRYEAFVPLRLHVIEYFAGCVGLRDIGTRIPLPNYMAEVRGWETLHARPRPWIIVCRNAGPFTPNKDWPEERWIDLIPRLAQHGTVLELGSSASAAPLAPGHVDLRGATSLRQFCAIVSLADLAVTPVTSTVHIAAAYDIPTLSILGGYELPENTAYRHHRAIARQPSCAPCWLRSPCPYDRKCLRTITVEEVETTALAMLKAHGKQR